MKSIPSDKLHFYTEQHLKLIDLIRQPLKYSMDAENLRELSQLESSIVIEAFQEIERKGIKVFVTYDRDVYKQDLRLMEKDPDKVYILCNIYNNLRDLSPLLRFVSSEKRAEYSQLNRQNLSGK